MKVLVITPRFTESGGGDGLYAYWLSKTMSHMVDINILTVKDNKFIRIIFDKTSGSILEETLTSTISNNILSENYYSFNARKALVILLNIFPADIIHIHGMHQYFTSSIIKVFKEVKIPIVFTVHDYKILCGNAGFFSDRTNSMCVKCINGQSLPAITERCKNKSIIKSVGISVQMSLWKYMKGLEWIRYFHCGSEYVYKLLEANSQTKEKRYFLRMPIIKDANNNKIMDNSEIRIVYSGRLVPHKGPNIFASIVKNISDIPIEIFGDGPLMNSFENNVISKKNVTLHGWQSHDIICKYLKIGTIVIIPYLAPETFCYVALEAMLNGCCVIASKIGAIPELIKHGKNGVLVDNKSPENFRVELLNLLSNREKIFNLGSEAMKIRNELDQIQAHSKHMLKKFEEIVEGNK